MPTIKVESEWDKTIETIAQTLSDCDAFVTLDACDTHDCLSCPTHKQVRNCYYSLSDCDKLAVQNRRRILAAAKISSAKESSLKYMLKGTTKDVISAVIKIAITIIMTLALFGMIYILYGTVKDPYKKTPIERLLTYNYGDSEYTTTSRFRKIVLPKISFYLSTERVVRKRMSTFKNETEEITHELSTLNNCYISLVNSPENLKNKLYETPGKV